MCYNLFKETSESNYSAKPFEIMSTSRLNFIVYQFLASFIISAKNLHRLSISFPEKLDAFFEHEQPVDSHLVGLEAHGMRESSATSNKYENIQTSDRGANSTFYATKFIWISIRSTYKQCLLLDTRLGLYLLRNHHSLHLGQHNRLLSKGRFQGKDF